MQLEQLFKSYKVPPASDGLASGIIIAASHIPQKQSIWRWISRMFEEFMLPAPAYSLASMLIVGFLMGVATYKNAEAQTAPDNIIEQLLYQDDEELL